MGQVETCVTELRRGRDVFQLLVERYEALWYSAGYCILELLKVLRRFVKIAEQTLEDDSVKINSYTVECIFMVSVGYVM